MYTRYLDVIWETVLIQIYKLLDMKKAAELEHPFFHEGEIRKDSHDSLNISKPNRSQMGIIGDLLDVTMQGGRKGVIISTIQRKANLSYYAVLDKCQRLISAGLVKSAKNDHNRVFIITEKGLEFFQEFRRFKSLIESMNLRY